MPSDRIKEQIVDLFLKNVKGQISNTDGSHPKHAGKDGHWLERQMQIAHNASNAPDLLGYEMKNHTTSGKTTFGDWSPDYRIWADKEVGVTRSDFLRIFGAPNATKNNRYSWSGKPAPKISAVNDFGQILKINKSNDIEAVYYFSEDKRPEKLQIVPQALQIDGLVLARWSAEMMKERVESKFNQAGWFKCLKDENGIYCKIVFGAPVTFENWLAGVRTGQIIFDSGMYDGNMRPYANWRAANSYWENLITDTY